MIVTPPMPRWFRLGLAKDPAEMTGAERQIAQDVLLAQWLHRVAIRAAQRRNGHARQAALAVLRKDVA